MVEVRGGLAETMLELEEKCCRGDGWGLDFRFVFGEENWANRGEI